MTSVYSYSCWMCALFCLLCDSSVTSPTHVTSLTRRLCAVAVSVTTAAWLRRSSLRAAATPTAPPICRRRKRASPTRRAASTRRPGSRPPPPPQRRLTSPCRRRSRRAWTAVTCPPRPRQRTARWRRAGRTPPPRPTGRRADARGRATAQTATSASVCAVPVRSSPQLYTYIYTYSVTRTGRVLNDCLYIFETHVLEVRLATVKVHGDFCLTSPMVCACEEYVGFSVALLTLYWCSWWFQWLSCIYWRRTRSSTLAARRSHVCRSFAKFNNCIWWSVSYFQLNVVLVSSGSMNSVACVELDLLY